MTPRQLMRLEHESQVILEAPKMDEPDVMDREVVSRRRSVLTLLHLVLRLASLAQSRMKQLSGEIDSLKAELVQKVLEGLRGDAYLTAQDLGVETLVKDGGIETLVATLKKMLFPLQSLEAKELFQVGQMQHGPLSRQTGESVTSVISNAIGGGAR